MRRRHFCSGIANTASFNILLWSKIYKMRRRHFCPGIAHTAFQRGSSLRRREKIQVIVWMSTNDKKLEPPFPLPGAPKTAETARFRPSAGKTEWTAATPLKFRLEKLLYRINLSKTWVVFIDIVECRCCILQHNTFSFFLSSSQDY